MKNIKSLMVILGIISGCSTTVNNDIPNMVVCIRPDMCIHKMEKDCPTGGVIFSMDRAIKITYACKK